jgi:hypothetical protein
MFTFLWPPLSCGIAPVGDIHLCMQCFANPIIIFTKGKRHVLPNPGKLAKERYRMSNDVFSR